MSGSCRTDLFLFPNAVPQFSARVHAMICLYELLREEWDQQMDKIERLGIAVRKIDVEQADVTSHDLGVMERQLPVSYCFPGETESEHDCGTVASALDRLLKRK